MAGERAQEIPVEIRIGEAEAGAAELVRHPPVATMNTRSSPRKACTLARSAAPSGRSRLPVGNGWRIMFTAIGVIGTGQGRRSTYGSQEKMPWSTARSWQTVRSKSPARPIARTDAIPSADPRRSREGRAAPTPRRPGGTGCRRRWPGSGNCPGIKVVEMVIVDDDDVAGAQAAQPAPRPVAFRRTKAASADRSRRRGMPRSYSRPMEGVWAMPSPAITVAMAGRRPRGASRRSARRGRSRCCARRYPTDPGRRRRPA